MIYQPGQGLSSEAIARLRGRKDSVTTVFSDLLAQDESKQWENLLGFGATKKPRCSQCTRPLSAEDPSARYFLCSRCAGESGQVENSEPSRAQGRPPHLDSCADHAQAVESCQTSSTEVNSEEDAEASDARASQPPTPQDVVASLKSLLGEWLGDQGERYNLALSRDEKSILCSQEDKNEPVTFFFDLRDRLVWWGKDRSYFLDLSEWDAERLTWHDSGNGTAKRSVMEWRRGPPSEKIVRVKRWSGAAKPEQEVTKKSGSNKIPQAERYDSAGPEVPKPKAAEVKVEPKIAEASTQVQKPKELQPTQELEKVEHKNVQPPSQAQKPAEKKEVKAEPKQERKFEAEEEVQPFDKREVQGKADWKGRKVVWRAVSEREAPKPEPEPKKEWKEWEDWKDWKDILAEEAIKEITEQVLTPENKGFIWVDRWQERFSSTFGTVREFLESRPDKFRVTPTTGRGYRVALVKDVGMKWKPR